MQTSTRTVHLDLGCGFGRIAEPLTEILGCDYIGIDGAADGLQSLKCRGFEAHELLFDTYEQTLNALREILGVRQVSSLTMLDTLEHLPNGDMVLRVIRELIGKTNAPAVISVPNVAHRDVGFKLAFGHWDYTRSGLLDHTHTRLFSRTSLKRTFGTAGLHIVDRNDVTLVSSDQYFPNTHPALATGTTLHSLLKTLRENVDDSAVVNQFVSLVVAGPQVSDHAYLEDSVRHSERPFLSIVMRTQGKRPHCLDEALTALAGQEDRDFELLLVGHKLSLEQQISVERAIEDSPEWLRKATRLIRVHDGNRTRPLNRGFEEALGEYIAILDDDDIPMAHWVSTFRTLAEKKPGAMLRAICARQDVDTVTVGGRKGVRAVGGFDPYRAEFDIVQHLVMNQSPTCALAFPRGAFHELNIRFDESLTTTEDWDFLQRVAIVVGVSSSQEITSIYHWWKLTDDSSRTDHNEAEWKSNHLAVYRKIDSLPILLPAGSAQQLRDLYNLAMTGMPAYEGDRASCVKEITAILTSKSWRWSVPLRWPAMRRGRKDPRVEDLASMTDLQLATLLARLRRSGSWQKTRIFHGDRRK
ncbi:methyltransferase domain-containing protein [Agrobacterium fabrum]|uniref:methyltransferase domain-containing protein n=1 Tax=Agrobacterium fabrum TaxID=1176649 RepID=UPI001423C7A2|nr:methyltransferase domain-containing protein [Agrobacterium fabrum]NTB10194.1 methyltransferase domain-containing protein [Agrobacterium fabrum]